MMEQEFTHARRRRGWTQLEAAHRLGVSQPYLSMLEAGKRPLPLSLARKAMRVLQLAPTVLPLTEPMLRREVADNQSLAEELAKLGYPGFAYLRSRRRARNPAEVLLAALANDDLEARLAEALPWVLLEFGNQLDLDWLVQHAKLNNLQNRLGFVANLARRVAQQHPNYQEQVPVLRQLEQSLERSRLLQEDTLCQASLPQAKLQWLAAHRPPEAVDWNLLTDWRPEYLRYVR